MNIGLTGGIASGKSTVSKMLVRLGALLIDADRIAREVVMPGSPVLAEVAAHFGQEVLNEDGTLNRKRLGEIIFHDPAEREKLDSLMHPPIRQQMKDRMREHASRDPNSMIVVDVPLLYESGLESMFDEVVVVYVPESVQIARLMERNQLPREEAIRRLQSQMPLEKKRERADVVIDNQGTIDETMRQVEQYWRSKGFR